MESFFHARSPIMSSRVGTNFVVCWINEDNFLFSSFFLSDNSVSFFVSCWHVCLSPCLLVCLSVSLLVCLLVSLFAFFLNIKMFLFQILNMHELLTWWRTKPRTTGNLYERSWHWLILSGWVSIRNPQLSVHQRCHGNQWVPNNYSNAKNLFATVTIVIINIAVTVIVIAIVIIIVTVIASPSSSP